MIKAKAILLFFFLTISLNAQMDTVKLKEVIITSNRIEVPFSKESRTINILNTDDILNSSTTNVADILQNVVGIDVRRRGVEGMQSDLYIRGGSFNQTLLLIDGFKMDDVQTGHHSMNGIIPFDVIERIEVVKGPAARIYGGNAFTGAINIVSKKIDKNSLNLNLGYGSYNNIKATTSISQKFRNGNVFASVGYQQSDGYRYNTDFKNVNVFLKTTLKNYKLTTSFVQRKFGANGFYASPKYIDQYEETQTILMGVSSEYKAEKYTITPRLYWRRNQDMYLFLRQNPSSYRNLHISNKIGGEVNSVITSNVGKTGVGMDISTVSLESNNLGDHQRTSVTSYVEQRIELFNHGLDLTPGVALTYTSDFKFKAFPGIDIGYRTSELVKLYGNIGFTYRVPTFTEMYYKGDIYIGNPDLKPESALSEEIGIKINTSNFLIEMAGFHRKSDNLIDWTKDHIDDKWGTKNFSEVQTWGIETTIHSNFIIANHKQNIYVGYTYIDDTILDEDITYAQYSLNSIKHQFNARANFKFDSIFNENISFRYVERTDGYSYKVVDASITATLNNGIGFSCMLNNILNANYTETNLVPMPKRNVMFGLKYQIY